VTAAIAIAEASGGPAEWGAAGVLAVVIARGLWELILRLIPPAKREGAAAAGPGQEEREAFRRMEEQRRESRDAVNRIDDLTQVRRGDGAPAFYCDVSRLQPQVTEIHVMLGRMLDEERQSRGLLVRIARRLTLSTRDKPRE